MIKHETTLEEAKKIKELGYDFRFCVDKLYEEEEEVPELSRLNVKASLTEKDIWTHAYWEMPFRKNDISRGAIPIIPLLVLKACTLREVFTFYNDDMIADCFIYAAANYPEETKEQFEKIKEQYK